MTSWYQHYKSAFTPEECRAIVDYGLQFPAKEAVVGHGGECKADPIRASKVRWLKREDDNLQFLFDRIVLRCLRVNHHCFHFDLSNFPNLSFKDAQLTEYHAEENGHYDWHEDNCWTPKEETVEDRKISCLLQLSPKGTYKGGELQLERSPLAEDHFTDQGDLLFIPSFHRHKVTPVTEGVRQSLVVWFLGPRLR